MGVEFAGVEGVGDGGALASDFPVEDAAIEEGWAVAGVEVYGAAEVGEGGVGVSEAA